MKTSRITKSNHPQWLLDNVEKWFKSLSITKRMQISEEYSDETSDNTYLAHGLNNDGEKWLLDNYNAQIVNFSNKQTKNI